MTFKPPPGIAVATRHVGIDFGTTNSVLAVAPDDAGARPVRVALHGTRRDDSSYRSLLCFWLDEDESPGTIRAACGPAAIEAFRLHGPESRLIQSIKSFVASASFEKTAIFGRSYTIVDLISLLLRGLRRSAEADLGPLGHSATCGRPVHFAGQNADETLALERLRQAYRHTGFDHVTFVAEPQAAAHHYARTLSTPQTCLVADFGGGTSDFTLLRIEPASSGAGVGASAVTEPQGDTSAGPRIIVLGLGGIGIAGDAFDQRIVQRVVCPALGLGSTYKGMSGQALQVPVQYYEALAQWHRLSLMRTRQTLRELHDIRLTADGPELIERFMYLLENELGFELYTAVTDVMTRLSTDDEAEFSFRAGPIDIRTCIRRSDFEVWIAPELERLGQAVDALLESQGRQPGEVDRVFLTGGSSLIPAVRQLFGKRFGAARLSGGDEFLSIASGLVLVGQAPR